jgi:peptidyl-prolyl cis-trans isomerase SurA
MKKRWLFLVLSLVAFRAVPAELVNGVAAIVNDSIITYEDVMAVSARALDLYERQYGRQSPAFRTKALEAQQEAIESLVERKLILHEFKTAGYNLPESVIEDSIKRRIHDRFGDRLKLIQTLQAQGKTYENFRQEVREQIIEGAMRSKHVAQEILISPAKIESYYTQHADAFKLADQVKLRMIVLDKAKHGDGTSKLAGEIQAKLKEGVKFAEMATLYSDGSQAAQGGDWGWVERSVLREDLRDAAFSLPKGQPSDIIDKTDACYLMLVEDSRSAHVRPINEVRDEIEKNLVAEERARLEKKWIDRLRSKSFIRSFPAP